MKSSLSINLEASLLTSFVLSNLRTVPYAVPLSDPERWLIPLSDCNLNNLMRCRFCFLGSFSSRLGWRRERVHFGSLCVSGSFIFTAHCGLHTNWGCRPLLQPTVLPPLNYKAENMKHNHDDHSNGWVTLLQATLKCQFIVKRSQPCVVFTLWVKEANIILHTLRIIFHVAAGEELTLPLTRDPCWRLIFTHIWSFSIPGVTQTCSHSHIHPDI